MHALDAKSIFRAVASKDAFHELHAKAEYFPTFVRVYIPLNPIEIRKPGLEPIGTQEKQSKVSPHPDETHIERSLRRTRKSIKDYTLANAFDLFATFTFANNRQNILKCKTRMSNWLKNQRKRNGNFEYLIVPEFHKDKESLHFHALFQNYQGVIKQAHTPRGAPLLQRGKPVFTLPGYTLGFTNIKKIEPSETKTKVAYYIQKYIQKEMPLFPGKKRYWISRGVKRPLAENNPETWYKAVEPDRTYSNDYGTFIEFDYGGNVLVDMFIEANQR